jgi:hypothetical protein
VPADQDSDEWSVLRLGLVVYGAIAGLAVVVVVLVVASRS